MTYHECAVVIKKLINELENDRELNANEKLAVNKMLKLLEKVHAIKCNKKKEYY